MANEDSELMNDVRRTLNTLLDVAQRHYKNDDLTFGMVTFDLKGRSRLGQAFRFGLSMRFNMDYLREHGEQYLKTTVPHELSHVLTFQLYPTAKPHGKEWKSVMRVLGAEPNRCSKLSRPSTLKPPKRHKFECSPDCDYGVHYIPTRKKNDILLRGKRWYCNTCGRFLKPAKENVCN